MRFLIVVGTVREGRKTIHVARKAKEILTRRGREAVLFDPKKREIPYLGDRRYKDDEEGTPKDIEEFGEEVESADGVIIVTPEYNHSIPGVLKNLLDYLYPEYEDKPFSYITVSAGGFGGVRSLGHLHDITLGLNAFPGPSLQISSVGSVFDEEGSLIDDEYEERFEDFAVDIEKHVEKMS